MKLHKLISRTVLATALLGTTIGGAFAGINANADDYNTTTAGNVNGSVGVSSQNDTDSSAMVKQSIPKTKNGEVGANILDGTLTLDSVPNLGFGNNKVNSGSIGQDSALQLNDNNNSVLQVTDNRNIDKQGQGDQGHSGQTGWNLTAQLESFKKDGQDFSSSNNDAWKMTFNNLNISNTSANKGGSTPFVNNSNNSTDSSSALTAGSPNPTQFINATTNNTGYGTNRIVFNNRDYATLYIPNVQNGNYTTTMHWTLNSNLDSYNTGYNQ